MKQPTRRRGVRIVVHNEEAPENVAARTERVPEAGCDAPELLPVGGAVVDVSALAPAGEDGAVGAGELVRLAEVFADAESQIAARVERQPAQPVVRVVSFSVEER